MTTFYYLNPYGEITKKTEDVNYNVKTFFRKYAEDEVEKIIARILLKNPQPNCVKIYGVNGYMIDMEYVDTYMYLDNNHLNDIKNALDQLHKLNIVYIDLKKDNIGYSRLSDSYKLFDFNMSGIVDKYDEKKWLIKPKRGYILYDIMQKKDIIEKSLYTMDDVAINRYKVKELR